MLNKDFAMTAVEGFAAMVRVGKDMLQTFRRGVEGENAPVGYVETAVKGV